MIDEDFEYFLTEFPLSQQGPACTAEHEKAYSNRVPGALIAYWRSFGFSGFGEGRVWLVDPLEWETVVEIILTGIRHPQLPDDAQYIPVARSAFGEIWFWTPGFGWSLNLNPVRGTVFFSSLDPGAADNFDLALATFFSVADKERFDIKDNEDEGLFDRVLMRVGQLEYNEVYGFVPAIMYGGPLVPENVSILPLLPHLVLLREFMGDDQQSVTDPLS